MMAEYVRLSDGLTNYKLIPVKEDMWKHIPTNDRDFYSSIFKYNQDQYNTWKKTGTIAGIKDVVTNSLVFDFDNKENPEIAREDAITLVSRLLSKGITEDKIQVAFSGQKGYCVQIDTTTQFTPEEFKNVTSALAGDLKTFDTVVSDPQRIIRVIGTKHPKSGLYKLPLSVTQLSELNVETTKHLAKDVNNADMDVVEAWGKIELPEAINSLRISKKVEKAVERIDHDLDIGLKPKWISDAKFALQEGYFESGERNTAFMILASTYKNQGFNKEIVYRQLKGVAELQSRRSGQDRYSDDELWNNVVKVVFNPSWKGGQYSYENTPLLQEVTKRLGLKIPAKEENSLVPIDSITNIFKRFASDIDKNTVKLGIPLIDNQVRVTTSMLVGLLAAPSAGKTSVSLNVLNSISKSNLKSIFFSLDMGAPLVYQRLIQKHTSLSSNKIFDMYKNNDKALPELEDRVAKEYSNVRFCFRSGVTVDNIKQYILEQQEIDGERAKLVVIDYLECISGPFSDATANTALIAQQLKDVANELEICILLLLQPQKHAGDPSSELLSMRNVKGSSVVEQAASIIFTMWRDGFNAKNPEEDKFLSIAVVKNRMGSLGCFNFTWDGLTGEIRELEDEDRLEFEELKKRKAAEKAMKESL